MHFNEILVMFWIPLSFDRRNIGDDQSLLCYTLYYTAIGVYIRG